MCANTLVGQSAMIVALQGPLRLFFSAGRDPIRASGLGELSASGLSASLAGIPRFDRTDVRRNRGTGHPGIYAL